MLEKGKISAFQMAIMMYPTIVATAILTLPGVTAKYAKNDLWLSPIYASLVGILTVYIAYRLHRLYPKQTIVQYSEHIVGVLPGKLIGLLFILFYLHANGLIVRQYADFVAGSFLGKTPITVVVVTMVAVSAWTVRGGVEVIGRVCQIFTPIFIFPLTIVLLLIPDMKLGNLFPVMGHGIMPGIAGASIPQAWFSEYFLIAFLLPFLSDVHKGMKWGMISVLAVTITLIYLNLIILLLFGVETSDMLYPVLNAFRYISVANFFENLEAFVMAIWILGNFMKISVFYYAAALGTAQWLKLSDYRPIVMPLGFITMLLSFWDLPNFTDLAHFISKTIPFYLTSVETLIPLLLLIVALLRTNKKGQI